MINLKNYNIYFYFYLLVFFISLIAFVFVSWFLYNNFYKTITYSGDILILKSQVAVEDIDMNKFDEIIKKLEEKKQIKKINFNFIF